MNDRDGLIDSLDNANVPRDEVRSLLRAYDALDAKLLAGALDRTLARLGRYERKFGPGAPRLNAIEVLLNYSVQTLPGFRYDPVKGPGPWEIVASYTTAYFTYTNSAPEVVSASEFGLRHYNFREGWGKGGLRGYLKPGHLAFGMAVAGEKDGPLVWPGRGDTRLGGFFAWGDLKVAYVGGNNSRWLVTQQFQIIPLVF